jgi:hypothetical protein
MSSLPPISFALHFQRRYGIRYSYRLDFTPAEIQEVSRRLAAEELSVQEPKAARPGFDARYMKQSLFLLVIMSQTAPGAHTTSYPMTLWKKAKRPKRGADHSLLNSVMYTRVCRAAGCFTKNSGQKFIPREEFMCLGESRF